MGQSVDVVVVGAGVAGLTAAALLADAGLSVELLEAHSQTGGCAGTFRRGPYVFDVGATQVAGLEPGGSHARILAHLGLPIPAASPLDPACVVDLADGSPPVRLWRDPARWHEERERQFPGSGAFWRLCAALHQANWEFAARDPVLPPRNLWDLRRLLGALRPANLASGLLASASIDQVLQLCGCGGDGRLRHFLDLQLRLYSQEPAERTAALYGATVLAMAQAPLGLWHLQGSMQVLSTALEAALARAGGQLRLRHRVVQLQRRNHGWAVRARAPGRDGPAERCWEAADVVLAIPPQSLPDLVGPAGLPAAYHRRLTRLPDPSGALVLYAAVERAALPADCPSHLQIAWDAPGSLFLSVSRPGDGRAPEGEATLIASVFTEARPWFALTPAAYGAAKARAMAGIRRGVEHHLGLPSSAWRHLELATPRGFARWTGRPFGFVGGLGQRPSSFGPFGLASRTPLEGLWLCGDAIYPGEGTAGVTLSALMASRQLLARQGRELTLRESPDATADNP
ncbi:C-3',4' desaturase CrtD [Cyanobium sp. NIES-981]|uniref:C-3',4' desaturase CrtD n=1 Tax=Cyanobium sp. NIES-981 TaxID=1851505 RepID=UPI0007DCC0EA|nr:C-3',4' desaturase CrtD [Cyanobium sp. NIES-981]SBO43541.1 C-3',4' desaturase CrtD [Cyanobium sp. NIES-981]